MDFVRSEVIESGDTSLIIMDNSVVQEMPDQQSHSKFLQILKQKEG